MSDDGKASAAAVYVSWSTFKNAIDGFAQGVPNQVDRTIFPGLAGGVQSQLLAGLKFLGLTDDKGKPTAALKALAVEDEGARKRALEMTLVERYPGVFALDLSKATPAQVAEEMARSYNVTGETREKAVRFFLAAAEYVGVSLSSYLKPKANGGAAPSRKRRAVVRRPPPLMAEPEVMDEMPSPSGTSRVVNLKSGGTLTLSASVDVLSLDRADRDFVFALVDKMTEYEQSIGDSGQEQ